MRNFNIIIKISELKRFLLKIDGKKSLNKIKMLKKKNLYS